MSRKKKRHLIKFKVLLDECCPPSQFFPGTNHFHNLKHLKHDFNFSGISDLQVYKIATQKGRLIVTFNSGHFRKFLKSKKTGVIEVSQMKNEDIDKKLCRLFKKSTKGKLYGKVIRVTKKSVKELFSVG